MDGSNGRATARAARAAAAPVIFFLSLASAHGQAAPRYHPTLKEIGSGTYVNGKPVTGPPAGYCLYIAGDRTEPDYLAWTSTVNNLSLVHPLPQVAAQMDLKARGRWYASRISALGGDAENRLVPLLTEGEWRTIPAPLQDIVAALGIDDSELVLVSSNLNSGAISVYFLPAFDKDKGYYERKLDVLARYVSTHDMDVRMSLQEILRPPS